MKLKNIFLRSKKILLISVIIFLLFILVIIISKVFILRLNDTTALDNQAIEPFPVSVNSYTHTITADPTFDSFLTNNLAIETDPEHTLWSKLSSALASKTQIQNLASPVSRIFVIWPGERKEEVTKHISDVLHWDDDQKLEFERLVDSSLPAIEEGKYFPGHYTTHRNATPAEIKSLVYDSFHKEVLSRYTQQVESQVPLKDALVIASLIEREANSFENMREVSGVIWNRLFIDMPLQLDATLQYVKGTKPHEPKWWPIVRPRDKFITSPFNTYQNTGLPPTPISNPSTKSILAALNPIETDCLYYFHTDLGEYHCSPSYEGHVSKLRSLYGQGS